MIRTFHTAVLALVITTAAASMCAEGPASAPAETKAAIEKSLAFLKSDTELWRKKKDICANCHHGAITAWALYEAKAKGFAVPDTFANDTLVWTKARWVPEYEPKPKLSDGFEIPSLAMPLLAMTLVTKPDSLSAEDLDRIAKNIVDRQQPDGGWAIQQRNIHPVIESKETQNLWFAMSLDSALANPGKHKVEIKTARELAKKWLDATPVADTTQAVALRLLLAVRTKAPGSAIAKLKDDLFRRQNPDGGWSQTREFASDAYATGQALYVLSIAKVKRSSPEIARGVDFLTTTQLEDGSWKMIGRGSAERPPSKNLIPINHFAAAWATMGMVRSMP